MALKSQLKIFSTILLWSALSGSNDGRLTAEYDTVSIIYEAVIDIVTQCRPDLQKVFIFDDHKRPLAHYMSRLGRPMTFITYSNSTIDPYNVLKPTTRIDAFILVVTKSIEEFGDITAVIFSKFFFRPWWLTGPLYIINRNEPGCDPEMHFWLFPFLHHHDIVESYLICYSVFKTEVVIVTAHSVYRPVPKRWIPAGPAYGAPLTIFFRPWDQHRCKNLYFDRTNNLKGETLQVAAPFWRTDMHRTMKYFTDDFLKWVIQPAAQPFLRVLMDVSKMKMNFTLYEGSSIPESVKIHTNCHYSLVISRKTVEDYSCYESLYPIRSKSLNFIVRNRGYKTPLEKIRDYYGIWTLTSLIALSCLTLFVIWRISRNLSFATFEILRLYINSGIETSLDTLSRRIFFTMIFLYFLVFHATFNGHLAEFLTFPEFRPNPETLEDLDTPEFSKIIGNIDGSFFLRSHPLFKKYEISALSRDCLISLQHSDSIVCVDFENELQSWIMLLELNNITLFVHKPKRPLTTLSSSFLIRRKSPFTARFNQILLWASEARLFDESYKDYLGSAEIAYHTKMAKMKKDHTPINLGSLKFAFVLLGVGILLSTIAFISEIYIYRNRKVIFKHLTRINLMCTKKKSTRVNQIYR